MKKQVTDWEKIFTNMYLIKKKKLVSNMYSNDYNSILIKLTNQFANMQKICTGL